MSLRRTDAEPASPLGFPAPRPWQKAAVALGNGFELYDFSVFGFFAVPIGRTFFPATDVRVSLLFAVGSFGIGYLARPIGALVAGPWADRHGRKPVMLATMLLMAVGTLGIAILPGYAFLGIASPVLVVALRLVQGFALGGETGPTVAWLLETAAPRRRARAVAWQVAVNGAALLAAGIVGATLAHALAPAVLDTWGWRIAMLLGLGVVPVGLVLRPSLPDMPITPRPRDPPRWRSLLARPGRLIAATLVIASGTVSFAIGGFMTSYALSVSHLTPHTAFLAAAVLGVSTVATAPLSGWLADRVDRRAVVAVSRLSIAVVGWPGFVWLARGGGGSALLTVSAGLAALSTVGTPAALCLIADALPPGSRATGLSLAYALGISLFGSATQPAAAALLAWTGDPRSPAWLLVGAGLIGTAAVSALPRQVSGS